MMAPPMRPLGVSAWIYGDTPLDETLVRIEADSSRRGLGRGHLDPSARVEALPVVGQGGVVVLEVMAPGPDPFAPIKDADSRAVLDGYLVESLARLRAHGLGVPPHVLAG